MADLIYPVSGYCCHVSVALKLSHSFQAIFQRFDIKMREELVRTAFAPKQSC